MKIVTFATRSDGYFPYLLQSARRYKNRIVVLGWNEEWKGFGSKVLALKKYIQTVPDDEVVVFVDAYDVVFLRNLDSLEKEYISFTKQHGKRIVISASRSTFDFIYNIRFGKCKGQNLNSGTFIGYAGVIRRMLHEICSAVGDCQDRHVDDQQLFSSYCRQNEDIFSFDTEFDWFLIWGLLEDWDIAPSVTFQDETLYYEGKTPYVLHCPGNKDMSDILTKLGYRVPGGNQRTIIDYTKGIYVNHVKYFLTKYMVILCLISSWAIWKLWKIFYQ